MQPCPKGLPQPGYDRLWWEAACPFLSGSDPNRTFAFGAIWPTATRPLRNGTSKTSH